MWALATVPALPAPKRRDHLFVLEAVAASTITLTNVDPKDASLLPCQGRMSTCYLLSAERPAVVKIRASDRIALSPGNQKAVAIQRWIKGLVVTPETYSFGVVTHPTTGVVYEYVVEEYLPYEPPTVLSTRQKIEMYRTLGSAVRTIHSVKLNGFGDTVAHGDNRFIVPSWREWVAELLTRSRFGELGHAGVLSRSTAEKAQGYVRELSALRSEPTLYHGDLLGNWANFLVDGSLKVKAFLDWEFAGSGLALENEIASLLYCFVRDGVPLAEQEVYLRALLEGLHISQQHYNQSYRDSVDALLLVHAAKAMNRIFPGVVRHIGDRTEKELRMKFAKRARILAEQLVQSHSIG